MLNSTIFNNTFQIFSDDNNITLSHLTDDANPFSYHDYFQSPLIYYDIENYSDLLSNYDLTMNQQLFQVTNDNSIVTEDSSILEATITTTTTTTNMMDSNKGDEVSGIVEDSSNIINNETVITKASSIRGTKRRRTSNKDRHSKIRTAHGLRDRRMRLSVEVAKHFFKLQDMLGFDKASKTVEWLLLRSKTAIEEVQQSKNGSVRSVTKCTTISSISDCEGESSMVVEQNKFNNNGNIIINNINNNNNVDVKKGKKMGSNVSKEGKNNKEKRIRTTKEAMKKAREKARKRTLEKMQSRGINKDVVMLNCEMMDGNNKDKCGIWSYNQIYEICQNDAS